MMQVVSFQAFVKWAIEELNLGPHAYQARKYRQGLGQDVRIYL